MQGKSPFLSDIQHPFNLLYDVLSDYSQPTLVNPITGLIVALASVLPALCLLHLSWTAESDMFFGIFMIRSVIYLIGPYLILSWVGRLKKRDWFAGTVNELPHTLCRISG